MTGMGSVNLGSEFFEANPDQQSTADMVALNAGFATLATFQTCNLFAFAVQLLDFPAEATHLLGRLRGLSSRIIGHDPIGSLVTIQSVRWVDTATRKHCTLWSLAKPLILICLPCRSSYSVQTSESIR